MPHGDNEVIICHSPSDGPELGLRLYTPIISLSPHNMFLRLALSSPFSDEVVRTQDIDTVTQPGFIPGVCLLKSHVLLMTFYILVKA